MHRRPAARALMRYLHRWRVANPNASASHDTIPVAAQPVRVWSSTTQRHAQCLVKPHGTMQA